MRLETKGPIKDSDAIGVAKLIADLHALHSELAYRCPEKSKIFCQEEIARLGKVLEDLGAVIRQNFIKKTGKGSK